MLLDGEVSLEEQFLFVVDLEVDGGLAVDLDHDVVANCGDFLGEFGVGLHKDVINLDEIVKAAGLHFVRTGAVNLGFVSVLAGNGERFLELGAEVLARVTLVRDGAGKAENKIGEIIPLGEEVTGGAGADDQAILDFPLGLVIGVGFPTGEVLAIEELHKLFVGAGGAGGDAREDRRDGKTLGPNKAEHGSKSWKWVRLRPDLRGTFMKNGLQCAMHRGHRQTEDNAKTTKIGKFGSCLLPPIYLGKSKKTAVKSSSKTSAPARFRQVSNRF